jgi:formyltetrahydrofolate deformylase
VSAAATNGEERGAARLVVVCPDRPGIVAAVSGFLFDRGANITDSAQHSTDPDGGTFFMRMEFVLDVAAQARTELEAAFAREIGGRFAMDWRFSYSAERRRIAILVSRFDHCLVDLLSRWRRDELGGDVVLVVSNHPDVEETVRSFGVPFEHVPIVPGGKAEAEERLLELLAGHVDLVVLARYMQILSADFLSRIAAPVINIHHSFLPAFVGADPYRQALERGVKIIGATAHYATEDLDEGPIIEQDVARVSHRQGLADVRRVGRDIERTVLARAVTWHIEDRVIVHGNKTFVFE